MKEFSLELFIGDTIQIGEHRFTVVAIEDDEVLFNLQSDSEEIDANQEDDGSRESLPPR